MNKFLPCLLLLCQLCLTVVVINGQSLLTAVRCNARLPTKRDSVATVYDGSDAVYIFGGIGDGSPASRDEILKYSITKDTIENVGQLPKTTFGSRALIDEKDNIYNILGSGFRNIYQYFPQNQTVQNVTDIPFANYAFAMVLAENSTVYMFGGRNDRTGCFRLNLNTMEIEKIGELPVVQSEGSPSGIWDNDKQVAYIFLGKYKNTNAVRFTPSTQVFEQLPNYFPYMWGGSSSVWDGHYGYIIGGYGSDDEPANGIYQFDPLTEDVKFLEVRNFPGAKFSELFDTSAVFVKDLNRIYFFGGYRSNAAYRYLDEIWYISLDPLSEPSTTTQLPLSTLNPGIFDCSSKPDGRYSYPGDCTMFIICDKGNAYDFKCPEPLLFDPVELVCDLPQNSNCI